jgi:hypothetical protein
MEIIYERSEVKPGLVKLGFQQEIQFLRKWLCLSIALLPHCFPSLKLISLENKTENSKHELSYALHRPENTKEKNL